MLALTVGVLLLSSVQGGGAAHGEPASVAWDGRSVRLYSDAAGAVRFAVPTADFEVQARHHDRAAPPGKVKDGYLVLVGGEQALAADVFYDSEGEGLARFLEKHLSFLAVGEVARTEGKAGPRQAPAIFIDRPRSGQAFGQRIAVFAFGRGKIAVLACTDRDRPEQVRLFEAAVASFEELPR